MDVQKLGKTQLAMLYPQVKKTLYLFLAFYRSHYIRVDSNECKEDI